MLLALTLLILFLFSIDFLSIFSTAKIVYGAEEWAVQEGFGRALTITLKPVFVHFVRH